MFNCSPWFEWIVSTEPVQTEEKSDSVTVTQESQQPSDPGGENNKNKSNSEENHTNSGQRVSKHRDKEIIVLQTGRNVELQIKKNEEVTVTWELTVLYGSQMQYETNFLNLILNIIIFYCNINVLFNNSRQFQIILICFSNL